MGNRVHVSRVHFNTIDDFNLALRMHYCTCGSSIELGVHYCTGGSNLALRVHYS